MGRLIAAQRTQAVEDGHDFIYADIARLRFLRAVPGQLVGRRGDRGSLAKLAWAHCDQELANLAVDLIGPEALADRWGDRRGTSEINRTIVAQHVHGLPW